jgi:type I restriction enzyme, S subunit
VSEENELPEGWCWADFGDLTILSQNGCSKRRSNGGKPTIVLRLSDIDRGKISLVDMREIELTDDEVENYRLLENDLICIRVNGSRSLVGRMIRFKPLDYKTITFCDHFIRFRLANPESAIFLSLYFETEKARKHIESKMVSTAGQNTVSQGSITSVALPLPPLPEQRRIVATIEQQFTRLDAAVAALQHTKAKLKRYRASVLKAAVEGKLTEAWRAEHPATEPANVLLERILVERRAKWEADLRAKGKDLAKVKYVEPAMPDVERPPELPEEWIWVNLGQLAWSVKDGPHYSPKYDKTGIPFITGGNIRPSGVDFANAKYITPELHAELSVRCKPEKGDILYTKGGTTGIARVNTYDTDFNVWVHVAVLKLADSITPFYVQHALNSPSCYRQAQNFTHGVGNQDLGLTRMVRIVLGLPPLAEQLQIVAEIEKRLSVIDHLEEAIQANLKRAERLRQSILKEAFAGRLVPQDQNDEPASVLLERIHNEREGQKQGPIKKLRAMKTISAPRMPDVEPMQIDASEMEQMDLWANAHG